MKCLGYKLIIHTMEGKRIRIKSKLELWQLVLSTIFFVAIGLGVLYLLLFSDFDASYRTRSNSWELIGLIIFIIPILFSDFFSKEEYLSDIYITDDEVKLVYKIRNKISRTNIVQKNNIKTFDLNANIDVVGSGKHSRTVVSYRFYVDLIEGRDVYVHDNSDITLLEGNYKFIYRVLDAAPYIPNFKLNVESNNDVIKAELDYYRRFGKKIPFSTKFKMEMNKIPLWLKIIFLIPIILMFLSFGGLIYISIPAGIGLSSTEKEYISIINDVDYKNAHEEALYQLDKARSLISTDPYLYYRYAYIYGKKLKNYDAAIQYAKIGISNLGNKEVYYKQYKYSKPRTDEYLYDELGDCYYVLEEWEKALEAYTYVATHTDVKYTGVYFKRGKMYFYLKKYKEAKQDFIRHRDIITAYINTYHTENDKNATYDNRHLIMINRWIKSCDSWLQYESNN